MQSVTPTSATNTISPNAATGGRAATARTPVVIHYPGKPPVPSVAIVGPGGGIGATLFAAAAEGNGAKVYAVVRPNRVGQFTEKGIEVAMGEDRRSILPSEHPSIRVVGSLKQVPEDAVVITCVKSNLLGDSLEGVGSRKVITVQNGLGHDATVKRHHPGAKAYAGNVFISATRQPDRPNGQVYVKTGKGGHIEIGKGGAAKTLQAAFGNQGIFKFKVVDDIDTSKYKKVAMNCAMNPLATLFQTTKFGLRSDPRTCELVRLVIAEVCEVGWASGCFRDTASSAEEAGAQVFKEWHDVVALRNPEHPTSMQTDFKNGAETELPALNQYIAKKALDEGIHVPLNTYIAAKVRAFEKQRDQCATVPEFYDKHRADLQQATEELFRIAGLSSQATVKADAGERRFKTQRVDSGISGMDVEVGETEVLSASAVLRMLPEETALGSEGPLR